MNGTRLILLSAVDAAALKRRAENVASYLEENPTSLADVAYTLAVGRKRFARRAAITLPEGGAPPDVIRAMAREHTERTQVGPDTPPRVAFMFPGQGSLEEGMGREIVEAVPVAMEVFRAGSEASGIDLRKLCFDTPLAEMVKTENQQPALVATCLAINEAIRERGIEPDFVIGHSVGEFAALAAARSLAPAVRSLEPSVAPTVPVLTAASRSPTSWATCVLTRLGVRPRSWRPTMTSTRLTIYPRAQPKQAPLPVAPMITKLVGWSVQASS